MTAHPILFSDPMISALLEGRKTQTRRLAWHESKGGVDQLHPWATIWQKVKPGDLLWVRENHWSWGRWKKAGQTRTGRQRWEFICCPGDTYFEEPAAGAQTKPSSWYGIWKRSGLFMRRSDSRLTLEVKDVRLQRLQDMSDADAIAEGVEYETADPGFWYVPEIWPHSLTAVGIEEPGASAVKSYAKLWDYLHGPGAWLGNPTVSAISFAVHKKNVDVHLYERSAA